MSWLKQWLSSLHEWALLLVGAPVAIWGVFVGARKLLKLMMTVYEGGLFLLDVKAIIEGLRRDMVDRLDAIDRGQLDIIQTRAHIMDADEKTAFFKCDAAGGALWVSEGWKKLTGLSSDDAKGLGWEMGIEETERPRVIQNWQLAIDHKRRYQDVVTYVDRTGRTTRAKVTASPVRDNDGQVMSWNGMVRPL